MSVTKKFTLLVAVMLLLQLLLITRQQILLSRTTTLNNNITNITSEITLLHAAVKQFTEKVDQLMLK